MAGAGTCLEAAGRGCPPWATRTPRLPRISLAEPGAARAARSGRWLPPEETSSAAGCSISHLYRALKGIQRPNWEALKLKWGWDLESTLEPVVWREVWGSISSVLISRSPIEMFSGTFIPPALGFTRGFAFCSRVFFSLSLLFFLHSKASS